MGTISIHAGLLALFWVANLCVAGESPRTNSVSPGLLRCTTPEPRAGKAHERFLLLNQRVRETGEKARIVFIGDSITEGWEANGREAWKRFYEPRGALNLGIGSDHTQHVLWRMQNGNLEGLRPDLIVVLIGVNNVPDEGNSPGDILAGIEVVVESVHQKLPHAKVLLLGILPFREHFTSQRGKALQINQALERWVESLADTEKGQGRKPEHRWLHYLDVGRLFIQPDGRISRQTMRDFLHPSAAAYKMWAEAMEPTIAGLLGDKPIQP